jgi:hypothetical protein
MLNVNITGVHNCYSVAAKQMIKQGNCKKDAPGKLIAVRTLEETLELLKHPKLDLLTFHTGRQHRWLQSLRPLGTLLCNKVGSTRTESGVCYGDG